MAKHSSRVIRKPAVPLNPGAEIPLLEEFEEDSGGGFQAWRDSAHGTDDWESGTEDRRFLLE